MTTNELPIERNPKHKQKVSLIRPNWPIIENFAFLKSMVGIEFWLVDPKLLNQRTKSWRQNDWETKLGKVNH